MVEPCDDLCTVAELDLDQGFDALREHPRHFRHRAVARDHLVAYANIANAHPAGRRQDRLVKTHFLAKLVTSHEQPLIDRQCAEFVELLLLGVGLVVAEAVGGDLLVSRLAEPAGKGCPLLGRGVVVRRRLFGLFSHGDPSG